MMQTTIIFAAFLSIVFVESTNTYIPLTGGGRCKTYPICNTDNVSPHFWDSCEMNMPPPTTVANFYMAKPTTAPAASTFTATGRNAAVPRYKLLALNHAKGHMIPMTFKEAESMCGALKTSLATIQRNDGQMTELEQYRQMVDTCYKEAERRAIATNNMNAHGNGVTGEFSLKSGCFIGLYRVGCYEADRDDPTGQYFWTGTGGCPSANNCIKPDKLQVNQMRFVTSTREVGISQNCGALRYWASAPQLSAQQTIFANAANFATSTTWQGMITPVNCAFQMPRAVRYVLCDNPAYWGPTRQLTTATAPAPTPQPTMSPVMTPPQPCHFCTRNRNLWALKYLPNYAGMKLYPSCTPKKRFVTFVEFLGVKETVISTNPAAVTHTVRALQGGAWGAENCDSNGKCTNKFTSSVEIVQGVAIPVTISVTFKKYDSGAPTVSSYTHEVLGRKITLPNGALTWDVHVDGTYGFGAQSASSRYVFSLLTVMQVRLETVATLTPDFGIVGLADDYKLFDVDRVLNGQTPSKLETSVKFALEDVGNRAIRAANMLNVWNTKAWNNRAFWYRKMVSRPMALPAAYMPNDSPQCWKQNDALLVGAHGYIGQHHSEKFKGTNSYRFFTNFGVDSSRWALANKKKVSMDMSLLETPVAWRHTPYAALLMYNLNAKTVKAAAGTNNDGMHFYGHVAYHGIEGCYHTKNNPISPHHIACDGAIDGGVGGLETVLDASESSLATLGLPITATTVIAMAVTISLLVVVNVVVVCYCCMKRIRRKRDFVFTQME